jgi:xylulokinase
MYILGYDLGSSSVKASLMNAATGQCVASAFAPKKEMEIMAKQPGWAEQHPEMWWENAKAATAEVLAQSKVLASDIKAIGISYQMHGLVTLDKQGNVVRPAIIWCDSRAVSAGNKAFSELGADKCLSHLLNSPGNFTAAKLKWVKENEPELYNKIDKIMLPGDYLAYRLTGEIVTTASGLSEGILWDFVENKPASFLINHLGFDSNLIPTIVPTFSNQGSLTASAAAELGLAKGTPICYRAGDQPNNAFSLNVLNPGEIAATAGTSGVVYGVSGKTQYDPQSRVNTFLHVNHKVDAARLGVLLCINGTGILNSWVKRNAGFENASYEDMNVAATNVPVGSDGLVILPFGNGAERMLANQDYGCRVANLNFNRHSSSHIARAAQEGIVFSFCYGMEIMRETGIQASVIRAGKANMFLSPIFRSTLANTAGCRIELCNTDGAQGAARGAGIGAGIYKSEKEAFESLTVLETIVPEDNKKAQYQEAYQSWKKELESLK